MSNLRLCWDNVIDECAISAAAATFTAGLPLSYLLTRQIDQTARVIDADSRNARFYVKAPAKPNPISVAAAALIGANFSAAGQWRLRGFAVDPQPDLESPFTAPVVAPWTYTRASVGRAFNANGANLSKAADVARINHAIASPYRASGILLEGASTNWVESRFANWAVNNGTFFAPQPTGIDQVANSARWLKVTAGNCTVTRTPSSYGAPGGTYTLSVWLWGLIVTGAVHLSIDNFATFTVVAVVVGQWTRVQLTGVYVNGAIGIRVVNNGDEVFLDFAQFEPGTGATSEILMAATPNASRAADVLQIPDITASGFTPASMTMAARFRLTRLPTARAFVVGLIFGGGSGWIGVSVDPSGQSYAHVRTGGADQALIAGPVLAVGDRLTSCMSWKANDIRVSFEGTAVQVDASATLPNPIIIVSAANSNDVCIELERVQFWKGQRADADLVAIAGGNEDMCPVADADSGFIDAWPAAYLAATPEREQECDETAAPYFAPAPFSQSYFRVEMKDEANADGFLEAGRLCLFWSVLEPQFNVVYGKLSFSWKARSTTTTAHSGSRFFEELPVPRTSAFGYDVLSEAEAWRKVFPMIQRVADTGEVLYCENPDDLQNLPRNTYLCTISTLPEVAAITYGLRGAAFKAEELL